MNVLKEEVEKMKKEIEETEKEKDTLALEIIKDEKRKNQRKNVAIAILLVVIVLLIVHDTEIDKINNDLENTQRINEEYKKGEGAVG